MIPQGSRLALVLLAAASCDAGPRSSNVSGDPRPAKLRVLGANVGPSQRLAADGVVQVALSRYLLPSSVTRQSMGIVDAFGQPLGAPLVAYDPVARTVTLANPSPGKPWLIEDQLYKITLGVPEEGAEIGGFRTLDRGTLVEPFTLSFLAGPPEGKGAGEPKVSFCADVLPLLLQKCASCHSGSERASAGLLLDSSNHVAATAIGRVAHGSSNGGPATASSPGRTFVVNMPLVDRGNPANSWLLYKILMAPFPSVDAGAPPSPACQPPVPPRSLDYTPLVPVAELPEPAEQQLLRDMILGQEMPPPSPASAGYAGQPLTFAERERVRLWIAQGADVYECGACGSGKAP